MSTPTQQAPPQKAAAKPVRRPGDLVFAGLSVGSASLILLILAAVAIFLIANAVPVFRADPSSISGGEGFFSYVWPLVAGTVMAATIAMLIATPVAVGIALYVSHYAPRRIGAFIGFVIDLLAAVPSVVYGLWGYQVFAPQLRPFYEWLADNMHWLPIFGGNPSATGRTILTAGLVLAVMILPIITSVSREVFLQTPKLHEEAALALGATKWEMIRTAVLPFGKPGIIGGTMLGLGRALGETMAVAMILSVGGFNWSLISPGNQTIPSEIALNFPEAQGGLRMHELIAAGLVLFVITLAVNLVARWIVERSSEFSGAN